MGLRELDFALNAAMMDLQRTAGAASARVGFCTHELVALALRVAIAFASNTNLLVASLF